MNQLARKNKSVKNKASLSRKKDSKKKKANKKNKSKVKYKKKNNKNNKSNKNSKKIAEKVEVYKVEDSKQSMKPIPHKERNIQTFLLVLIIILAIAAIFSAIQTFFPDMLGRFSLSGELAAKVNGVPITMQELNQEYDRLSLQYKYAYSKEDFLQQLIDEMLLVQEASERGLGVTEQEINSQVQSFMQSNNITGEALQEILKQKNLDDTEFKELITNQLLLNKLLEQELDAAPNITSEQALEYYNDNPDTFRIPALVTARHILIGIANRTMLEAETKANMVYEELEEDMSNFCDLVEKYTDDSGSEDNCGKYTFARGQMVEEFENTAFSQDIGETSLINTSFGYHIILTINKTPEQLIPFKDVQEQISLILEKQQQNMVYSDLVARLREEAEIIKYYQGEQAETEPETAPETEAETETTEDAEVVGEAGVEELEEEVIEAGEEQTEADEPVEEETEEAAEEATEEAEEEAVEEALEEEEETSLPGDEETFEEEMSFTQCLSDKGAVLYGAYWDSSTAKQKSYFTDSENLEYIECGVKGDYKAQQQVCVEAGIEAYPTWIITDEQYMGVLDKKQLSMLTGC